MQALVLRAVQIQTQALLAHMDSLLAATHARKRKNSDEEDSDFIPDDATSKRNVVSKDIHNYSKNQHPQRS